jgi:hypothetical protein
LQFLGSDLHSSTTTIGAVSSVTALLPATILVAAKIAVPVVTDIAAAPSESDDNPNEVDLAEQSEEMIERNKNKANGFDVVET